MRKLLISSVMLLSVLSINARIEYIINKYGVMMVNFVSDDDSLTLDLFRKDWNEAIDIATSNKKVKQIQFKNTRNEIISYIAIDNIANSNDLFNKLVEDFSNYNETETVYGDSVLVTHRTKAQYHSDTYINGKLDSQYTSDWESGYFAPSESTYKSGNNVYRTKKYYTAPKIERKWERKVIEQRIVKKGETKKLEEIYKRTNK